MPKIAGNADITDNAAKVSETTIPDNDNEYNQKASNEQQQHINENQTITVPTIVGVNNQLPPEVDDNSGTPSVNHPMVQNNQEDTAKKRKHTPATAVTAAGN